MASSSSKDNDQSPWNCPLCSEILQDPKLLPCSHTFCKACLEELVTHRSSGKTFSCPTCSEEISVPSGGVSAFKNNFYMDPADLSKESGEALCRNHTEPREIELYCSQCGVCICLECKLDSHLDHNTEDVKETAKRAKEWLQEYKKKLDALVENLKSQLEVFLKEEKAVQDKRKAVKAEILRRHEMMASVARNRLGEALSSLDIVTASIDSELHATISDGDKTVDALSEFYQRLEMCTEKKEWGEFLLTAKDISRDAERLSGDLKNAMAKNITRISRPVLQCASSARTTLRSQQQFLGTVVKIDLQADSHAVNLKVVLQCPESSDFREIYSLFPRDDETVWIAYERLSAIEDGGPIKSPQLFDYNGTVIRSETSISGRTNFTHSYSGTEMSLIQKPGYFSTFAKSRKHFRLNNNLNGKAFVCQVFEDVQNASKTFCESDFCVVLCGPHRAFDVGDKMTLLVVVEEAQHPALQRKVLLYNQPGTPVATYLPPTQPCQPSDVCFCRLGGCEVLMVADEVNDAIHVVSVERGCLQFLHYLAPGCPLLLQPTALNTDISGRLWVACRNGTILVCEIAAN